jgi:hypothetical protein
MVLTVVCARSSCREAVAREKRSKNKRSKNQNDRIGHLVNLIKFWSIWFKDGCLQQGAASGCNRHREQNNRCTLINRVKLYSVRVRDITFWHQSSLALLDIHSSLLEYYFRILNTERISPLPPPLFPTRQIKRLGYRGAWVRILNTEETSTTLSTHALIAVEKLYNRREKRSKYKFSETGNIYKWGRHLLHGYRYCTCWESHGPVCRPFYLGKLIDATIWSCMIGCRTQYCTMGQPHTVPCNNRVPIEIVFCSMRWGLTVRIRVCYIFFWSSFIISDGRSVVESVDCCLLFKLSTQLEIEVLQLLHSIHFALTLIYPVAT